MIHKLPPPPIVLLQHIAGLEFSRKPDGGTDNEDDLEFTLIQTRRASAPPDSEPYVKLQLHIFIKRQTVFLQV